MESNRKRPRRKTGPFLHSGRSRYLDFFMAFFVTLVPTFFEAFFIVVLAVVTFFAPLVTAFFAAPTAFLARLATFTAFFATLVPLAFFAPFFAGFFVRRSGR